MGLQIQNIDKLHLLAAKLLELEKIEADEFEELFTTGNITKKVHAEVFAAKKEVSEKKPVETEKADESFKGNPVTES